MRTSAICRRGSCSKMPVYIPERLVMHIREEELPDDWSESGLHPATQDIGDGWLEGAESAVLQVPSAAVFGETDCIVNPEHPDFHEIGTGQNPAIHLS